MFWLRIGVSSTSVQIYVICVICLRMYVNLLIHRGSYVKELTKFCDSSASCGLAISIARIRYAHVHEVDALPELLSR